MKDTFAFCRQFTQCLDDRQVYRGDDAMPLAAADAQAVADGLGGTGAIYHQEVHPDCFEADRIGKRVVLPWLEDPVFFDPLKELMPAAGWDHSHDPAIMEQVAADFFELMAVKDCYAGRNVKRSAYFGSRLAMTLFRIFRLAVDHDKVFEMAAADEDRTRLEEAVSLFLYQGMQAAAEAAQLRYESMIQGLSLLATTFCGALVRQKEGRVETVYFVCGDSQAYLLSGDGLALTCGSHAAGMSSYLNSGFREKAHVSCMLRSFEMPCLLFCATDGCFDARCFRQSPLAFELFLLDQIGAAEDMAALRENLYSFFEVYGRHDDSSSMAAVLYGTDYAGLQEMARQRRDALLKLYPELEEDVSYLVRRYRVDYKEQEKSCAELEQEASIRAQKDLRWTQCVRLAQQIAEKFHHGTETAEVLQEFADNYGRILRELEGPEDASLGEQMEAFYRDVMEREIGRLKAKACMERQEMIFADYMKTFLRLQPTAQMREEEDAK